MANPILESMLNQSQQNSQPANPFEMLMKQSPYYNEVMAYVRQNGGSTKAAFYNMCQQRGFDPNQIISMMQQK